MRYSGYEKAGQRWLVYVSNKEQPRVSVPRRWHRKDLVVSWDDFRVHLPSDAIPVESSPEPQGIVVAPTELLRFSTQGDDYSGVIAAIISILWMVMRPLFARPKEDER